MGIGFGMDVDGDGTRMEVEDVQEKSTFLVDTSHPTI